MEQSWGGAGCSLWLLASGVHMPQLGCEGAADPARYKEFKRNLKREYTRLVGVLQVRLLPANCGR